MKTNTSLGPACMFSTVGGDGKQRLNSLRAETPVHGLPGAAAPLAFAIRSAWH
jgi:hypothetical protein